MSDDHKLAWFISACCTVLLAALIGALYSSCEHQRDRRADCLNKTSAAECKVLFPSEGGDR